MSNSFARRSTIAAICVNMAVVAYHLPLAQPVAADGEHESGGIELPLSEMAVPARRGHPQRIVPDGVTVLTPSCDIGTTGACERLATICGDLDGTMSDNWDGTQTCTITFD